VTVVQPSLPLSAPTQLASAVEVGLPPEPQVTMQATPSQHAAPSASAGNQSPAFTLGLDNQTVTSGDAAVFTVFFQGRPAPSVQWFIDGVLVHSSDRTVVGDVVDGVEVVEDIERGTSTLTILSSTTHNESQYTCRVHNQWGSAFTNAHLFVLGTLRLLSSVLSYSTVYIMALTFELYEPSLAKNRNFTHLSNNVPA